MFNRDFHLFSLIFFLCEKPITGDTTFENILDNEQIKCETFS